MKIVGMVLMLLPAFSIGQSCRYDKDEYDKFLKVRKIEKEVKAVKKFNRGNGLLDILICNYGDETFFRVTTASSDAIVVGKQDAVIFLLDNDETVKSYPYQIYSSDYSGERFWFEGTYHFESPSDFDKIKIHSVKSIRLYYNSVYKDFDLRDKGQENLLDAAKCF